MQGISSGEFTLLLPPKLNKVLCLLCISLSAAQGASSTKQVFLWIAKISLKANEEILKGTNSNPNVEMATASQFISHYSLNSTSVNDQICFRGHAERVLLLLYI